MKNLLILALLLVTGLVSAQTTPPQFSSLLTTTTDYTSNTAIFIPQQKTTASSFSVGASNVVTITLAASAPSGYVVGAALTVTGFSTTVGQLINGIPYTILSVTGPVVTMSSPTFVHATATVTTDSGTAALAWAGPAFGGSQLDTTWGTTTYKAPLPTDCPVTSYNSSGNCAQNVRGWTNDYSKTVSWSQDGHFYMMEDWSGWLYLYDASSGPPYTFLRRINTSTLSINADQSAGAGLYGDASDWNWANTPSTHTLYYLGTPSTGNRTQLKSIDASNWSGGATIVRDFAVEVAALGGDTISEEREGNQSDDDNIWSFNVKLISSGTGKGVIRWNRSTNTVVSKSYGAGGVCGASACPGNANWVGTSPSGTYTIINWDSSSGHNATWTRGNGSEAYQGTTLAFLGVVDSNNGHADVGYDVNGVEVYVTIPDDIFRPDFAAIQIVNLANIQTTMPTCSSGANCNSGHLPPAGSRTVNFPCSYNYAAPYSPSCPSGGSFRSKFVLISMRATQGSGMGYMLFSPDDPGTDNTGTGGWGANESWAVQIDWATAYTLPNDNTNGTPATFYRIARAHSYGAQHDYYSQIDAVPDKTFSKISFTTNYDTTSTFGISTHAALFTLLPSTPAAATPTFSPIAGTYTSAQTVAISTTSGTVICTNTTGAPATNGTTGCTTGTLYTSPVSVPSTETLYAVAGGTGLLDSTVGSAAYTINIPVVVTPTCTPGPGAYSSVQTVSCSSSTSGSTTVCTINGTTPTHASPTCSSISIGTTATLKALSFATGFTDSAIPAYAYTITLPPMVVSIAIAPTSCSVLVGANCTSPLVCTATMSSGPPQACPSPVFTSAAPSTASVGSSSGIVTGVAAGSTTVSATASGFTSNNSTITVSIPPSATTTTFGLQGSFGPQTVH